jgi:alkanesulfonate monooxygenase SsuD/methylene tetrahydromethanopterin reductase-like flavin-dependent oxidoreductase (luciferase family)
VTVDHISGGRVECAVGAAWNVDEHRELGIAFPPPGERMNRLEEGIQVLKRVMSGERVSYDGEHYRLQDALYRPAPVQRPHPPIWVGGTGRRRLLPIAGHHADVWHGWADSPEELAQMNAIVDRAAEEAGRDPASILRASNLSISEPWDEVVRAYEWMRDGGIGYLVVEWPTEGRGRLDEFIGRILPSLD